MELHLSSHITASWSPGAGAGGCWHCPPAWTVQTRPEDSVSLQPTERSRLLLARGRTPPAAALTTTAADLPGRTSLAQSREATWGCVGAPERTSVGRGDSASPLRLLSSLESEMIGS